MKHTWIRTPIWVALYARLVPAERKITEITAAGPFRM